MQTNAELLQAIHEAGPNLGSKKDVVTFLVNNGVSPATRGFDALVDKIMQRFMIGKYQGRLAKLVLDNNELQSFRRCYIKAKQAYDYASEDNVKAQSILGKSFYQLEKYTKALAMKYMEKYGFKPNKNYGNPDNVLVLIDSFYDNYRYITGQK